MSQEIKNNIEQKDKEKKEDFLLSPKKDQSIEEFIEHHLGSKPPSKGFGINVTVLVYERPKEDMHAEIDGKKTSILLPDSSLFNEKITICSGLVIGIGPEAFTYPEYYFKEGKWVSLGDWVVFPRYDSVSVRYKGKEIRYIRDIHIIDKIEDPRDFRTL